MGGNDQQVLKGHSERLHLLWPCQINTLQETYKHFKQTSLRPKLSFSFTTVTLSRQQIHRHQQLEDYLHVQKFPPHNAGDGVESGEETQTRGWHTRKTSPVKKAASSVFSLSLVGLKCQTWS